jgi:spore coat polysaccharide biosynthesis protein SpsF
MKIDIVLATSSDDSDDQLAEISRQEGINVFRGTLLNKIKRWYDCACAYPADHYILVDGDDLCFDYQIGLRVHEQLKMLENSKPIIYQVPEDVVCGLFTSAISYSGLMNLYKIASSSSLDTDIVTNYVDKADLKQKEIVLEDEERGQRLRLTLDYIEDLEFFRQLFRLVPWDAPASQIIETALANHLNKINWFRQEDYLSNQENVLEAAS